MDHIKCFKMDDHLITASLFVSDKRPRIIRIMHSGVSLEMLMDSVYFPSVTPSPAAGSSPSNGSSVQNGPSSSTSDQHTAHIHYSSDNDEDSETDDEALQKEISRLREKYVTYLKSNFTLYLAHECYFLAQ